MRWAGKAAPFTPPPSGVSRSWQGAHHSLRGESMVGPGRRIKDTRARVALMQAAVVSIAVAFAGQARAVDQEIGAETQPPAVPQDIAATPLVPFDVGFGVSVSTEYASRGITNSG